MVREKHGAKTARFGVLMTRLATMNANAKGDAIPLAKVSTRGLVAMAVVSTKSSPISEASKVIGYFCAILIRKASVQRTEMAALALQMGVFMLIPLTITNKKTPQISVVVGFQAVVALQNTPSPLMFLGFSCFSFSFSSGEKPDGKGVFQ